MKLDVLTTGGTIDKIYFDQKSEYEVGDPVVGSLLESMNVGFDYEVDQLMKLDSLDMTDEHRRKIYDRVCSSSSRHILITHGTDGMIETAQLLEPVKDKTIVLTGALKPAAFAENDAVFNLGCAIGAISALPAGVYIVMNGQVFSPNNVRKNRAESRFERIE